MNRTREAQISDLFTITRGKSKYTRPYSESHPGEVPIYSASLGAPMAYGDTAEYTGPLLTFTTNGYGGTVQIIDGDFTINGDRAVLLPKDGVQLPDCRYLARVIEQAIRPLAVGRRADAGRNEYTKISPKTVEATSVPLLVDEDGQDDFQAMQDFGESIERAAALQSNLQTRLDQLNEVNVVLEVGECIEVSLGDEYLFERSIGKRVLRSALKDTGEVPVYSANVREPMGYVDAAPEDIEFDTPSLIWGIDGVFDWNLIPAGTPFVPTDHCGRLKVLDGRLDPEYLLYALRTTKDSHGFDRVFRANLANIGELTVNVPAEHTSTPDLGRQEVQAKRYRRIDAIRDEVVSRLATITGVAVAPL